MLFITSLALLVAPPTDHVTTDVYCSQVGATARAIMEMRQSGAPLSAALEAIDEAAEDGRELYRAIVFAAYEEPAFVTAENKLRAENQFRSEWELRCHKAKEG